MKYGDAVDVHGSRDAQVAVFADSRAATHRWETRGAPIRSFECGLARSKSVALCSWPPRVARKVVRQAAAMRGLVEPQGMSSGQLRSSGRRRRSAVQCGYTHNCVSGIPPRSAHLQMRK